MDCIYCTQEIERESGVCSDCHNAIEKLVKKSWKDNLTLSQHIEAINSRITTDNSIQIIIQNGAWWVMMNDALVHLSLGERESTVEQTIDHAIEIANDKMEPPPEMDLD